LAIKTSALDPGGLAARRKAWRRRFPADHSGVEPLAPSCDCFLVSGEASGDAYAAGIARRLAERDPDLAIAAAGGPELKGSPAELEVDMSGSEVMGFLPVLRHLPELIGLMRRVVDAVRRRRPKVVVTVDYPGFNLRLIRRCRRILGSGTRFVHVVAPQVWAWRPRRAKRIARDVDTLVCLLPFEPPLFARFGGDAVFLGHPLADLAAADVGDPRIDERLDLAPSRDLVLLAPGSRRREIDAMLPVLDEAVRLALPRLGGHGSRPAVVVAKSPSQGSELYRRHTDLPLIEGCYRDLCRRARVGLVVSGTATLEAALCGLPPVICYRGDPASMKAARHMIRTEHIGLPNIVLGRRAFPEVLQHELTAERLAAHLLRFWSGPRRDRAKADLVELHERLGRGGAIGRIADLVLSRTAGREAAGAPDLKS